MSVARWTGKALGALRSARGSWIASCPTWPLTRPSGERAIRQVADEHGLSEAEIKRRLKEKA